MGRSRHRKKLTSFDDKRWRCCPMGEIIKMFRLTTTGQFPSYYKTKLTRPKENFHFLIISNINLYYGTTTQVNRISFNAHVQRRVIHSKRKVYQIAIFAIENYRQCYQFCKINGSARIHISVNLYFTSFMQSSTYHRFLGRFGVCADKIAWCATPNVPQKIVDA